VSGGARPLLVVLRALKLGDLLVAVPALRALAAAFPAHRRVLAAPGWLAPLAHHTGAVDELVDTEPLAPLDRSLHGADLAVNLHGRGPESTAVLAASSPRRLVAFGEPGCPAWDPEEHERLRWCRLLEAAGIPADPGDLRLEPPDRPPPARAAGATVLHPGASTGARRWPVDRWAEVATGEVADGRTVVVTGSADERPLAAEVAAAAGLPGSAVLAGGTDLLDLLALVASAARVVSGDTGMAHVASAMGTPSVVLFGPTSPAAWGPPPGPHVALWSGTTGDPLADEPDPGLLRITTEEVSAALATLPARVPAPGRSAP
jgi:ADP-heptose:LPS heptosyltransferase